MMNIRHIKMLDSIIGRFCVKVLPASVSNSRLSELRYLLLIRPGGIGDAVLLAPAVRTLRERYPDLTITVLAEKRNAGVFQLIPGVDRLLQYDRPRDLLRVLRYSHDAVIDTEQWHRLSALVARFSPATVRIGFETNERMRMFTGRIPYLHDDYEVFSFAQLLQPLGIDPQEVDISPPFLTISDEVSRKAAGLLGPLVGQPFVTVFPGASIPERRWGADRFRRVTDVLTGFGIKTVVVGGKNDRQQGYEIVGDGVGLNLAGIPTLAETAAVIRKSSLLISADSGVLHIAVGLGVPTVSLFGPGRAKKWAPRGERHIVINKGLSCSPCTTFGTTPPCPIDVSCMKDISVDEVAHAVTKLLTDQGTIPSSCCKRDRSEVKQP